MDKTLVKSYDVKQSTIQVHFQAKVVSIDCTAYTSRKDLSAIYHECKILIHQIKKDYHDAFGEMLKISNRSLLAEIWGHLVAYVISLWIQKVIPISFIKKLAAFAAKRSGMIDCGEAKVDTNRWFWDMTGWLFFRNVQ